MPSIFIDYETLKQVIDPAASGKEEVFGALLNDLTDKALLQRDKNRTAYKVHALIADIAWRKLEVAEADVKAMIESVAALLEVDHAKDNPVEKFVWVPFGSMIAERFSQSQAEVVSVLQNNLAWLLKYLGQFRRAKHWMEKALESVKKNFGTDHPSTATSYSNLAMVLKDLGDLEGAIALAEKSLAIFERTLPEGHPHIENVSYNLEAIKRAISN